MITTLDEHKLITQKLRSLGIDASQELLLFFERFFIHTYYNNLAGLSYETSRYDALEHYFEFGLLENIPPSPLFSNEKYVRTISEVLHQNVIPASMPIFIHWLKVGFAVRISPTDLFDEQLYLSNYFDIAEADLFGFWHYIIYGQFEYRSPNSWISAKDAYEIGIVENQYGSLIKIIIENNIQKYNKNISINEFSLSHKSVKSNNIIQKSDAENNINHDVIRHASSFASRYPEFANKINKLDMNFEPSIIDELEGLVDYEYYSQKTGIAFHNHDEAKSHYIEDGVWNNIEPNPFFEPEFYANEIQSSSAIRKVKLPAAIDWVLFGKNTGVCPTKRFDAFNYLQLYPQIGISHKEAYLHYIQHGLAQNLYPNALFNSDWYLETARRENIEINKPAFLHYLTNNQNNTSPSAHIEAQASSVDFIFKITDFDKVMEACVYLRNKYPEINLKYALAIFTPQSHKYRGTKKSYNYTDLLVDYLLTLKDDIEYKSPLFNPDFYSMTTTAKINTFNKYKSKVLHYLCEGWQNLIFPSPIFNEQEYTDTYKDIDPNFIDPAYHFMFHGIFEGRLPSKNKSAVSFVYDNNGKIKHEALNWRRFIKSYIGYEKLPSNNQSNNDIYLGERINNIFSSNLMKEIIKRANEIDPEVDSLNAYNTIYHPPLHDIRYVLQSKLQDKFNLKNYDTIVTVPWIRNGGADLVSCQVAKAASEVKKDERVLIIILDRDIIERHDWLPKNVDCISIADILEGQPLSEIEILVYSTLLALKPKRVINVNSYYTWSVFRRFGKRLRDSMEIYAYMFCWDQNQYGMRAGYPSEFFSSTISSLTTLFTDTEYLKDELSRIYALPESFREKIVPLYSPMRIEHKSEPLAHISYQKSNTRKRPLVLWGGRLDRQKRFDIVVKIASAMPDFDFMAWGEALLDAPPDLSTLPQNLRLNKPFKSFDEIPLDNCDAWLFTSSWEGMPTILIELAARGIPIVTSSVGGIPELVDDSTGFPVKDIEDIDSYCHYLRLITKNPEEALKKATNLQDRAFAKYTNKNYKESLSKLFDKENNDV